MLQSRTRIWPVLSLLGLYLWAVSSFGSTTEIQFNRDIRPLLSENCYACHGPDKNQRKAKLRLDVREVALERGAIVPGKTSESKLIEHIFSNDPEEMMPPPESHKKLAPTEKELLKRWIAEGAKYEPHWAYIPLHRPETPAVKNQSWPQNPIDNFVLHNLEAKEILPSPEADKRTLLRRLSLDLRGLPPTVAEMNAFLADHSADAYEHQVDRLLGSPHFGERMAVPWLDVVRFADTVGYHGDQNQNVFPYRDYVIDAFNRNKPFDQFTIEQLAGDLLPNPSVEAKVATCFNRLNMMTREGGAQPKEYLAKYAADRVRTVSMTWLGSTMGCAECHDHKFDPFSTKDFYSMEAFFADLKQWGVYADYNYTPEPELKGVGNDHPFFPEIEVDNQYLRQRAVKLHKTADKIYARFALLIKTNQEQQAAFSAWKALSRQFLQQHANGWVAPVPIVTLRMKDTNAVAQTNFTIQPDAAVLLTEQARESTKLSVPLSNMWLSAIRLEITPLMAREKTSAHKRNRASISLRAALKRHDSDEETKLNFYDAEANYKEERYAGGRAIIGVKDSWQISTDHDSQFAVWVLDKPIRVHEGDELVLNPGNAGIASLRASLSPFANENPLDCGDGEAMRKCLESRTGHHTEEGLKSFLLSTDSNSELVQQLRKIFPEIRYCRAGHTFVTVAVSREPRLTRVLRRGNWQDESGEVVQPAVPHFLPQISNPQGRRLTRLDLARWLIAPENPLTARAVVNRFWKQFFGAGLSAVIDDLGAQGEWPLHPELIDWLACEFREPRCPGTSRAGSRLGKQVLLETDPPWDVKHIVKLMVMSATYRQTSNLRPDLKEVDPNNRLLAFEPPRRLEAEFVRDNALFIAGMLNLDIGGPSVHPYQPAGYYANLQFPDRDYFPEKDERQYRRGIYMHWQRTFLHPMLANFDAPPREECSAMRVVSNTPQQALTLLNDPSFVEAARVFAASLLATRDNDDQRLTAAFQRALARLPKQKEKQSLLHFLSLQRQHYQKDSKETESLMEVGFSKPPAGADKTELAAWTQVCRVILNLQETVTRY